MKYQITARYEGTSITGQATDTDHAAIMSMVTMLPPQYRASDVGLIMEHIYDNRSYVAWTSNLSKYYSDIS